MPRTANSRSNGPHLLDSIKAVYLMTVILEGDGGGEAADTGAGDEDFHYRSTLMQRLRREGRGRTDSDGAEPGFYETLIYWLCVIIDALLSPPHFIHP